MPRQIHIYIGHIAKQSYSNVIKAVMKGLLWEHREIESIIVGS
jgi:hypothetical protein